MRWRQRLAALEAKLRRVEYVLRHLPWTAKDAAETQRCVRHHRETGALPVDASDRHRDMAERIIETVDAMNASTEGELRDRQ